MKVANITNIELDSLLIVLIDFFIHIAVVSIIALITVNSTSNASSLPLSSLLSLSPLLIKLPLPPLAPSYTQ